MAQFPVLYGEASSGKTKVWSIRVYEKEGLSTIETEYGFEDGKKQTQQKYITSGKNIGKKNETTALQQAINEARATWVKKCESGYAARDIVAGVTASAASDDEKSPQGSPLLSAAELTRGKASDLTVPFPMLAHSYSDRKHNIKWPCFVQPKLDGVRCLAIPHKGLFSRQRKLFGGLAHIQTEVDLFPENWILDGELYSDTLTFQEIVGLVKKEKPTAAEIEKQLQIHLYVYDMVHSADFKTRSFNLGIRVKRMNLKHIRLVSTQSCENESAMLEKHTDYIREGYEGIMLRNKDGLYKQATSSSTRSADLQKYKEFKDAEYEIVGYHEGTAGDDGCVVWDCETEDGQSFACRPRGTRAERMEWFENGEDYIGSLLTVRYQELTDDGVPRFPVGIAIRDYE